MKIEAKIKELKESFKEWNDTTEGFPSERLLTAINKVISHKNSLTNPAVTLLNKIKQGKFVKDVKIIKEIDKLLYNK